MIPVDKLLYEIDVRLNRLSSGYHQKVPLEDKILILNEAQISLIKTKYSGHTSIGFDATKKRYEDLQVLIEPHEKHGLDLSLRNESLNEYVATLENLNPKYLFFVSAYIKANKGDCKDRIVWVNGNLINHADINYILSNEHTKPSFEYQEVPAMISSNEISVFTDGTFEPTKLHISYIRYPKFIDKEGYYWIDGTPSVNQDCELPSYLEDELLTIADQRLAMFTDNVQATELSQLRKQTIE